ncbi:MAG: DegT/DnrJ/EryC1/StrS aminotransferase family protein [Clostridia bacterium]|nr:DegT/DnrJ/EryC1/StrS aminotransferase family protein [Clostridia bacterium]
MDKKRVIPFSPPDVGEAEIQEIAQALQSGWITTGPRTKLLEKRLAAYLCTGRTDVDVVSRAEAYQNKVVCLSSCTAAEELILRILGIGPGDEVIVPAYTYTATAAAVIHCGARVVFVDIQKDGDAQTHLPEMDFDRLEKAITPQTKAVIPVDLGGLVCDYERLYAILDRKKPLFTPKQGDGSPLCELSARMQKALGRVAVVADSAHSLGASRMHNGAWTYCGRLADFTCFSFHAVKSFTTGEGGAAAWNPLPGIQDEELYRMFQLLSLHGQSKDAFAKSQAGSWEYDIIGPWYKCNMTDVMGAMGLRQLDRFPQMLERRQQLIRRYDAFCDQQGIAHLLHTTPTVHGSGHLYLVRIPNICEEQRNQIIEKMAQRGVAVNVHFKPLPMMTAYRALGWDISAFPNAYAYYQNLISLPLYSKLSDADADYVCSSLQAAMEEIR